MLIKRLLFLLLSIIMETKNLKSDLVFGLPTLNAIAFYQLITVKTMTNLDSSVNQKSSNRQASQQILKPEQKVYLYGDTRFTGTLIRPLERTYPPRWTIELDRGGYDSATVNNITPLEPYPIESTSEIPFSDDEPSNHRNLEQEIIALKKENARLQRENERLTEELAEAKQIIRRAKDISPVIRLSVKRVMRLAHHACMDVHRTVGGWILEMGDKARKFRRLADIWDILSPDDWCLSEDIFPEDKLIPIEQIQPPKPRPRPLPARFREPEPPFPITREDFLRARELAALRMVG
jgi:hypothetical protein